LCGGASSPAGKASVEVLERPLEAHLGWIQLAHRLGEAVLGEVSRRDPTRFRDQLHRSLRWPIVAFGEHVDVRMRHPLAVELARELSKASVAELLLLHQQAQCLAERSVALGTHSHHLTISPMSVGGCSR
jgi:hypothetical protein